MDQIYIDIEANRIYSQEGESGCQTEVYELLKLYNQIFESHLNMGWSPWELEFKELKSRIEDITQKLDEQSIFSSTPN